MKFRTLGTSGLEVSVISFGAWQIGDTQYWGDAEQHDAQAAVDAALDTGINFFDTAEMYGAGESEQVLGRCLAKRREEAVVASKIWPDNCKPGLVRKACEASLQRLNMDHIDLYQIHWPFREASFEEVWEELAALREEGKIRFVGLSNFGPRDLEDWMAVGESVSNQLPYNLVSRSIELEVLPACRKYDHAVLVYMPLLQGFLSGRWKSVDDIPQSRRRTRHFASAREGARHGEPGCEQALMAFLEVLEERTRALGVSMAELSLAWLLHQEDVTSVITGARKPEQVLRNARAVDLAIPPEEFQHLTKASDLLKEQLGRNPDLWIGSSDSRYR